MTNRQLVACTFKPNEGRSYTYHNDGETLAIGDKVEVESRHGIAIVHVCEIDVEKPDFDTKPILGRAHPEEAEQAGEVA
jgi:hypothetical protein